MNLNVFALRLEVRGGERVDVSPGPGPFLFLFQSGVLVLKVKVEGERRLLALGKKDEGAGGAAGVRGGSGEVRSLCIQKG